MATTKTSLLPIGQTFSSPPIMPEVSPLDYGRKFKLRYYRFLVFIYGDAALIADAA